MAEKQLIAKWEKERTELRAKAAAITARLVVLDDALASVRALTGAAAPKRLGAGKATGTKSLILDVLADGRRRSCPAIADAIKAKAPAVVKHLTELVASGDVSREGKSRATTYGVA